MRTVDTSPMDLALRVAAGQITGPVLDMLQRGFTAFLDADGVVPLERCLRLPNSPVSFRKAQRNRWLLEVAKAVEGETAWAKCTAASAALTAFIARGEWRAWRDRKDPPAGTSNLRTGLFYAVKFNDGEGLSPKQVSRCIGHFLPLEMSTH